MDEPRPLTYLEQAKLLENRGMKIDSIENAKKVIGQLGYYRIKEVARPLAKVVNKEITYDGVSFNEVISRYYQDKNLRVYLLHCIEEVEVSIKTNVAYVLGQNGPFNYLKFSAWCNRSEYCKHYLFDRQKDFKRKLRGKLSDSSNPELSNPKNLNEDKFPSIWLAVDVLSFGDVLHLIYLMSQNNLRNLANFYGCTPNELISWLKCLKFVRNICAHNSNIIDIKLGTTPLINEEWKPLLYEFDSPSRRYTDRIAVVICVLKRMMKYVNPDYNYKKIYSPINTIASTEKLAQQLGFKRLSSIDSLFPKKEVKKHKYRKNNRGKNKCK